MLSDVAKPTHLFRVLEVLEEGLLVPGDTLVHVGSGVGEAIGLTGLTAEDAGKGADVSASTVKDVPLKSREKAYAPVKVRTDFVRLARTNSVALSATGLEETSTLASVTYNRGMSLQRRSWTRFSDNKRVPAE